MSKRRPNNIVPVSPSSYGVELQGINNTLPAVAAAAPAAASKAAGGGNLTSIHVTALDGIVNVNSLFTMALFIGFSMTVPENVTAATSVACTTSRETVRRLIVFEVVSFSFFLFSSLIAQSLKLQINLQTNLNADDPHKADVNATHLKYCLFASAVGSVLGCTFLVLSIIDFIRVKLGSLSCGGKPIYAVVTLVIFVGAGLVIYVITAGYASFFVRQRVAQFEEDEAAAAAIAASAQQNQS